MASRLSHSIMAVKIDEIDWKLHAEGVNGFTRQYPKAFFGREMVAPEQALSALWPSVGHLYAAGENSLAGQVRYLQAQIGLSLAAFSRTASDTTIHPANKVCHCCDAPLLAFGIGSVAPPALEELSMVSGCSGFML